MRGLRGAAVLLALCTGSGCAAAQAVAGRDVPEVPPSGWIIPTDSANAMLGRANLVSVHPRMSGPYPRDLVTLLFRPGATAAQRRAALHAVGGTLLGGDGVHHYVRVTTACDDLPVWCASDILVRLPQVEAAHPYMMGGIPAASAPPRDRV